MNAVGIDVSKGKSMVAAINNLKQVTLSPLEFEHTESGFERLVYSYLLKLNGEVRVIMEATGRYHEPVAQALHEAGIYVSVVNPILIHGYGNNSVRRAKTDRKDALKIARYGIDNWAELREYTPLDTMRQQLKLISRQYNFYMDHVVRLQNNLIALLDKTFPGANELFASPVKKNGQHKWVDFVSLFWHCDCIARTGQGTFVERYKKWCKRKGYNFSEEKALDVYSSSLGHFTTLPKNAYAKLLITTACAQLTSANQGLAMIKAELLRLSALMPEYEPVKLLYGVGEITAAQLMAEIGDVRRFDNRNSLIAFAGIDPSTYQSGKYDSKSSKSSKRGSPHLRKTLFQVVATYLKRSPADEPVFQFLDKKRAEGKHFYVYMTAAANKFLRIYYARIKTHLLSLKTTR